MGCDTAVSPFIHHLTNAPAFICTLPDYPNRRASIEGKFVYNEVVRGSHFLIVRSLTRLVFGVMRNGRFYTRTPFLANLTTVTAYLARVKFA